MHVIFISDEEAEEVGDSRDTAVKKRSSDWNSLHIQLLLACIKKLTGLAISVCMTDSSEYNESLFRHIALVKSVILYTAFNTLQASFIVP